MKLTITIFLCCFLKLSLAQNLVINPSFEDFQDCPRDISFFHLNVKNWSIPNNGTTDYFNSCSENMGFDNFMGYQPARTGNGYAGIHTYFKKNYREYIQGKLRQQLENGKTYEITFYVCLAEKSTHTISEINLQFYANKVVNYSKENLSKSIFKSPKIIEQSMLNDSEHWIKLKSTYKAQGFENYFIIGNFDTNRQLEKERILNVKGKSKAYYYIDDISIISLVDEILPESISEETFEVYVENKTYTFNNVLFDFDKSELLEASKEELNQLSKHLRENSNLNVEIYGHTDNVGLDSRNTGLSKQRAKAVADFLIDQGLNNNRIQWFGYGSSKPISTNDTEEGRELNRRVDFKLIEK